MVKSSGRFRRRTRLRTLLPWFLINLGAAAKPGRDCGDHEWYRFDTAVEHCYHCAVGQRPYDAAHFRD
ncbi:hypothetical protein [Catellatospora vulcania]|uniref:hypothetical protein n=1 Tax=Catellatospora vulcania TaxID=1460450 RepID=UPI0012D46D47|nr:hypothetical protein [Catellatospora vulcania]